MASDKELCQNLDDSRMDTECDQPENSSNSPANVAFNVESEPMECSDDSVCCEFATAKRFSPPYHSECEL